MNITFLKLYITDEINNGFYNSQEIGLAKALVEKYPEHRVNIVLLTKDESRSDKVTDKVTMYAVKAQGIGHHGVLNLSFLNEIKTDLVHLLADNMIFAPQVIDYCLKNNIKCHLYIGTLFTDSTNRLKQTVSKFLMNRNIAAYKRVPVYVKTPYVQTQLREMGVEAHLAPVGLSKDDLTISSKDVYDIREHFGLPFNRKILLYVGRLEEYKRPLEALELLRELIDKTNPENGIDSGDGTPLKHVEYHLLMIGDGEMSEALESKIKELHLDGRVRHIKKVPNSEMKDIYKASDVFVNFNRVEIYGMAILEAMANYCPVIAMKAPGPEFILEDGKTGFLCDSTNMMLEKTVLLSENENIRQEISACARKHVEGELTWNRTVECFKDIN